MGKEKELVKNTAIITFGKICTQLVSFFLLPLYTAVLSTSEYGTVDIVLTYSSLLLPFVTLALEQALFRFLIDVRGDNEKCGKYISTTVFLTFLFTILLLFVLSIISLLTGNSIFLFFGLVLFGSMVSAVTQQIGRGLGDNVGYTISSTLSAIIQILCNILFLVIFKLGAPGMMLASFIGSISCGILLYFRCNLKSHIHIKYIKIESFRELSKYSIPLIPNQLSWWVLNAADKMIVHMFIGVFGNGLIAVANKFSSFYISFSNIFSISWTESAALHINDNDAVEFFTKTINSVYRLFLCACCGIIVFMPYIFPVMVHSQYDDAYGLIPIFMLASLFNVIVSLYGVIYSANKNSVEMAKTAVYAAILNIVSHIMLIKYFGIYAAAISTMIGYGGMAVYRYFHSRKYMTVKLSNTTLLISAIMIIVSVCSYYSKCNFCHIIALLFITILSFFTNKNMIKAIILTLLHRLSGEN